MAGRWWLKGVGGGLRAGITVTVIAFLPVLTGVLAGNAPLAVAAGSPPPSTASQERGMVMGRPWRDPVDADVGGQRLTITLTAAGTRFSLAGRPVWGQSYNGSYVAPTIHVRPGSRVTIVLVNHLPVATNLHFHGLHVSPAGDADNQFLCVAPGATFTYHLDLPADHPLGTYWYHSHAMGKSCPAPASQAASSSTMTGTTGASGSRPAFVPGDVENQIFAGLAGALVSATTAACCRLRCATSPRTPSSSRMRRSTRPVTSCRTPTRPRSTPTTRPCGWSTASCDPC